MTALEQFLEKAQESLNGGTFAKVTLSQPREKSSALRNVYGREITIREGERLSLVWHYATRDVTKNFAFEEGIAQVRQLLNADFERARLFTTEGDWDLRLRASGETKIERRKATFTIAPEPVHDHAKTAAFGGASAPFLRALDVTTPEGKPRPGMADKLRQIQRFGEILGHLLDGSPPRDRKEMQVVDMGAGKGYLTFATAELLRQRGVKADVLGLETRADLVDLTNRIAKECGYEELQFVRGNIGDFNPQRTIDIVIALHACNTATDDAIFKGIKAGASLIIVAPCCHQELRPQIEAPPVLEPVLRHGILCERDAEILTDGIRALLLEIHGYQANVFEFISQEHTGKNLMIAAQKRMEPKDPTALRRQLHELLQFYGIRDQRLARLLGEQEFFANK